MKLTAKQQAFRIALSYGVAAGCWIFLSDELTTYWFGDSSTRGYVSLAKGWGFVLVTTGLLFFLLRRLLRHWEKEIEQRQNMEAVLRRGERAQRIVSECTQAIVRATAEPALLEEICRVIVQAGGYRMAWVGFPENDAAKSIRFAAQAGDTDGRRGLSVRRPRKEGVQPHAESVERDDGADDAGRQDGSVLLQPRRRSEPALCRLARSAQ